MFKSTKKSDQRKAMEAMQTQLEANFEAKHENYGNGANSLIKGSITNAIKMGKLSKDEFVRNEAYRLDAEVSQLEEHEMVNQSLFNDLFLSLGSESRAMEQLEIASELSSHDKASFNESMSQPYVKLKEHSIDDDYTPRTSSLNGEIYWVHNESGDILTKEEFNYSNDMKHNKDAVKLAGFSDIGPNDQAPSVDNSTESNNEFSGMAVAKAAMGL